MSDCFLRLPTVKSRTGLSRSTLLRRISEGRFPAPVPLGGRTVGWLESEVNSWMEQQVRLRKASISIRT